MRDEKKCRNCKKENFCVLFYGSPGVSTWCKLKVRCILGEYQEFFFPFLCIIFYIYSFHSSFDRQFIIQYKLILRSNHTFLAKF